MMTGLLTNAASTLSPSEITRLFLALAILLGLARLLGETAKRFKQPTVLGEILAGILLGPTVFGYLQPEWFETLYPSTGNVAIVMQGLVVLSVSLLLLVAGLEVDLSIVWRQGKVALWVSAAGIACPFIMGGGTAWIAPGILGYGGDQPKIAFALFMGIALSITALPVIAKILIDMDMFKSDIGMLIMSAAMMNDLFGWIVFAVVLALISPDQAMENGPSLLTTIALTLIFIGVMLTVVRIIFHRLIPFIQAHVSWPGGVLGFVLVMALLCAAFTEHIGVHSIFGAFIAGVAIGDSHHLRERTRDTIHQFITNIFAPIFFASIGLGVNFITSFEPVQVLVVLTIAIVGKIGGSYFGARRGGMAKKESLGIGYGMAAQGAMGIILGELARTAGLITEELFVAIVIMALTTSLMAGPLMQRVFKRAKPRSLSKMLNDRHVIARLNAVSTQEAIVEMAERASEITNLSSETIADAVWKREQMMRTGLEHGLAVPHARFTEIEEAYVLLGISEKGVDFDSSDGEPARLIFLLLTPENDTGAQLELLSIIAKTFSDDQTRLRTRRAINATEVLAAIALAEAPPVSAMAPKDDHTLGVS